MLQDSILHLQAPAKVNLFLAVLSKRQDGYHELCTWMQKLDLYDTLTLRRIPSGVRLFCSAAELADEAENIAYKAAVLFFKNTGISQGVEITLEKKIPLAAGLGGGSSDAAAVLTGLNNMFKTGLSEGQLIKLGVKLGADVPFFIMNSPAALAMGIGEKLQEKDSLTGCWLLLVNPGFPVSTKWVFENFDSSHCSNFALTTEANPYILTRFIDSALFGNLFNDLESVTIKRYPDLEILKKKMDEYGALLTLMSGSGPTVFGLFTEFSKALSCRDLLEKHYPGNVFITSPISSQ